MTPTIVLPPLPLVGRDAELEAVRECLDVTGLGHGRTILLSGEGGIGKSRLAEAAIDEAKRRDWRTAIGRANEVEADLPYSLFADVLLPTIETLSDRARAVITGGVLDELAVLFPSLAAMRPSDGPSTRGGRDPDFRNRLFWNFAQVMSDLTRDTPLVVVLEDLQWADPTSLELTHFLARQTATDRVAFICTYRDDVNLNAPVQTFVRSLVSLSAASVRKVGPLAPQETHELVRQVFGVPAAMIRPFTALLHGWTRGNPFFIQEVLKTLIETGRLRQSGGTWLGWELETLELPDSVRDTVMRRIQRLGSDAREVAELVAVMGSRVRLDVLESVSGKSAPELLPVLDELATNGILADTDPGDAVTWSFDHPIIRETMYAGLGRMRAGVLHGVVARSLETHYGSAVEEHAGELAYHLSRAIERGLAEKTIRYLEAAGRKALKTYANQEAFNYLRAALDRTQAIDGKSAPRLISALAHACQRLGRTSEAIEHWEQARDLLIEADAPLDVARVQRRLGLAWYWTGGASNALREFEAGSEAAKRAGNDAMLAGMRVARGLCLQELGRADEARVELEAALQLAESEGSSPLLARVHRALLLLYLWTGPPETARKHGALALDLAMRTDDAVLSFWVHWALAVLAGLTGDSRLMDRHLSDCHELADRLRSPVLKIWTAELAIELAFGRGEWDAGIALGEQAIAMASALNQPLLLARLLVWTSLIHLGRGDLDRGKALTDEAWQLAVGGDGAAGGEEPTDVAAVPGAASVHSIIPAHIGRATYHLVTGDFASAIAVAEAGLAVVDRTGYDVWAVHRLLPVATEAALQMRDTARAAVFGDRLREVSERLGHRLGQAWAATYEAITVWFEGDPARGAELMRQAAERLEAIPFVPDATRLRRQLAGRLADIGDTDGAARELRLVYETLDRLGAENELEKVRKQFAEIGKRPPVRINRGSGALGLTDRELEVARAVAADRSNKAVSRQLKIEERTVTTHLTNVYRKLGIQGRKQLADVLRSAELRGELEPGQTPSGQKTLKDK